MSYNGKIYTLFNEKNEMVYVGSTCRTLKTRFRDHRHYNAKWRIQLHEAYPCDSRFELEQREEHWRLKLNPRLNKNRASTGIPPCKTMVEYRAHPIYRQLYCQKRYCIHCKRYYFCRLWHNHADTKRHSSNCIYSALLNNLYMGFLIRYGYITRNRSDRMKI
jgi:hypothetical protein